MGQYWKPVNLDKKEFINAHVLGGGLKLLEHAEGPVAAALVLLLAPRPGRGGGDFTSKHPLLGHWAGDRIIFAGDYSVDEDAPHVPGFGGVYRSLDTEFKDISEQVVQMLDAEIDE